MLRGAGALAETWMKLLLKLSTMGKFIISLTTKKQPHYETALLNTRIIS